MSIADLLTRSGVDMACQRYRRVVRVYLQFLALDDNGGAGDGSSGGPGDLVRKPTYGAFRAASERRSMRLDDGGERWALRPRWPLPRSHAARRSPPRGGSGSVQTEREPPADPGVLASESRIMRCSTILLLVLAGSPLAPDPPDRPGLSPVCPEASQARSTGGVSVGSGWLATYTDIDHESSRPDRLDRGRLYVEWDPPERTPLNWVRVSGRICIEGVGAAPGRALDWFEGVRVLTARNPGTAIDWSRKALREDSVWVDYTIGHNGEFCHMLNTSDINCRVGASAKFQFGVTLAEATGNQIYWPYQMPALPQSISWLDVPGPPELSPITQLINGSPSPHGFLFDPLALIRAVNHLRSLGREGAMIALRVFADLCWRGVPHAYVASFNRRRPRIPENLDSGDGECLFLIVRLLYDAPGTGAHPRMGLGAYNPKPGVGIEERWPRFPIVVEENIPFFGAVELWLGSGMPRQPETMLDWYEEHGIFVTEPLCPANDPLAVADCLACDSDLPGPGGNIHHRVRQQAARMLPDDPRIAKEKVAVLASDGWIAAGVWEHLREAVAEHGICWNAASESYVLGQ